LLALLRKSLIINGAGEGNRTLVKIQQLKDHSLHAETAKEKHLCFATETSGASVQKMDGFEIVSPLLLAWLRR